MLTVASLCSGYGGLEMGLGMVEDVRLIWHAENDPHAATIHETHWPGIPNIGDITTADWGELEAPDVLTAGYPCQTESGAGQRKGADDERWIWPDVADAVRVLRPRRVLLENVRGHLSLGFGTVLGDLADLGYDARWACVRASDVGAPHPRERVFVVAYPHGDDSGGDGRAVPREVQGEAQPDVRPVEHARPWLAGHAPAVAHWEALTRPAPELDFDRGYELFAEWMMGLPAGWVTDVPIPRGAQLRAIGNGVVPHCAAYAWQHLNVPLLERSTP